MSQTTNQPTNQSINSKSSVFGNISDVALGKIPGLLTNENFTNYSFISIKIKQ